MSQPFYPSIDILAQRLAQNNRRVGRLIEQLPTLVSQLMGAWNRQDHRSLRELSQKLVLAAASQPTLSDASAELDQRLRASDTHGAQRAILALVGEVGSLRRRGIIPATVLPSSARH